MKSNLISMFLVLFVLNSYGQDKVEIRNNKVRLNGEKITMSEYVALKSHTTESLQKAKSAQSLRTASSIIGFSGGFLVGFGFGQISSQNGYLGNSGGILYAGLGLVAVSLPLSIIGSSDLKKSANLHNGNSSASVQIGFKENGLTVGYLF